MGLYLAGGLFLFYMLLSNIILVWSGFPPTFIGETRSLKDRVVIEIGCILFSAVGTLITMGLILGSSRG